jgi:hypothetical protein
MKVINSYEAPDIIYDTVLHPRRQSSSIVVHVDEVGHQSAYFSSPRRYKESHVGMILTGETEELG